MNEDRRVLTDEKREKLRQVIIDLFGGAMFHDVGLREICAEAGVATRTIYKQFGNKDELLLAAISPDLDDLAQQLSDIANKQTSFEDRAREIVYGYIHFYFAHLSVARIVFLNVPRAFFLSSSKFLERKSRSLIYQFHEDGRAAGAFRDDVPVADVIDVCIAAATLQIQLSIIGDPQNLDPDAVSERLWRALKVLILKE